MKPDRVWTVEARKDGEGQAIYRVWLTNGGFREELWLRDSTRAQVYAEKLNEAEAKLKEVGQ